MRRVSTLKVMESGWCSDACEEKSAELVDLTSKVDIFIKMVKNLVNTVKQAVPGC